jgi:hypothetical protein
MVMRTLWLTRRPNAQLAQTVPPRRRTGFVHRARENTTHRQRVRDRMTFDYRVFVRPPASEGSADAEPVVGGTITVQTRRETSA